VFSESQPHMNRHDSIFLGLLLLCLCGLVHCWVWWFRIGRRQPGKRTGRSVAALAYGTLLPLLLIGLVPRCYIPLGENLIVGLPFVATGLILASMGEGRLRQLLAVYVLMCFLMFVVDGPSPPPDRRPKTNQTAGEQKGCQPSGL
jgi:hypothetical protein